MLCQHCEVAPCEPVCPVFAAYHTSDGLNAQIYNRCVGTRYCGNNCPYMVRRFNWYRYEWPAPMNLQLNPDVAVRDRGIMEKCTMCVQRIIAGRDRARDEGRLPRDGEILTACQQTCPTQAITFGDLKDGKSRVSRFSTSAARLPRPRGAGHAPGRDVPEEDPPGGARVSAVRGSERPARPISGGATPTFADVNRDVLRTLELPGDTYFGWMSLVALILAGGIFCWLLQVYFGMGMAGKRNPQMWAMYITTFVFWIGIGHAGTLISAILYLFRAKWRTSIYRGSEAMTIFAVMTAGLFPVIHAGRMWIAYWLLPYPNERFLWPNFRSPARLGRVRDLDLPDHQRGVLHRRPRAGHRRAARRRRRA